jgi:hypothetical protein
LPHTARRRNDNCSAATTVEVRSDSCFC